MLGFTKVRNLLDQTYHQYYSLSRQKLQNDIVNEIFHLSGCVKVGGKGLIGDSQNEDLNLAAFDTSISPWIVFTAGPMGAGKSSTIQWAQFNGFIPRKDTVVVDIDQIREFLPESRALRHTFQHGATTQLEAGCIAELCVYVALELSLNVVVDGSMMDIQWQLQHIQKLKSLHEGLRVTVLHVTASKETIRSRVLQRAADGGRIVPPRLVEKSLLLTDISAFKDFLPEVQQLISVNTDGLEPRMVHPWYMTWDQLHCNLTPSVTRIVQHTEMHSCTTAGSLSLATTTETTLSLDDACFTSVEEGEEEEGEYSMEQDCSSHSTAISSLLVAAPHTMSLLPPLKYHPDETFENSAGSRLSGLSRSTGHNSIYKDSLKRGIVNLSDPCGFPSRNPLPSRLHHSAPDFTPSRQTQRSRFQSEDSTQSDWSCATSHFQEEEEVAGFASSCDSLGQMFGGGSLCTGEDDGNVHTYRTRHNPPVKSLPHLDGDVDVWARLQSMTLSSHRSGRHSTTSSCTSSEGVYSTHSSNILDGQSQLCSEIDENEEERGDCCTTGESVESVCTSTSSSQSWPGDDDEDDEEAFYSGEECAEPFPSLRRSENKRRVQTKDSTRTIVPLIDMLSDPTVSLIATFLNQLDQDIRSLEREGAASMYYVKEKVASHRWLQESGSCNTSIDSCISINNLRKKSRGACLLCSVDGLSGKQKTKHPRCDKE